MNLGDEIQTITSASHVVKPRLGLDGLLPRPLTGLRPAFLPRGLCSGLLSPQMWQRGVSERQGSSKPVTPSLEAGVTTPPGHIYQKWITKSTLQVGVPISFERRGVK